MITNEKVFIRFTGNNLHQTDFQRIDEWIQVILKWVDQGVSELYFFVHEPIKHFCADIATYMIGQLEKSGKFDLKAPINYENQLGTLF